MTSVIQCAIIEDEPLAQNILKKYIEDHPALELAAICNNAEEAQKVLLRQDVEFDVYSIPGGNASEISVSTGVWNHPDGEAIRQNFGDGEANALHCY